MHTFWIQLDADHIVRDILEVEYPGYQEVELPVPLPIGVMSGFYRFVDNKLVLDRTLYEEHQIRGIAREVQSDPQVKQILETVARESQQGDIISLTPLNGATCEEGHGIRLVARQGSARLIGCLSITSHTDVTLAVIPKGYRPVTNLPSVVSVIGTGNVTPVTVTTAGEIILHSPGQVAISLDLIPEFLI